MVRVRKVTIEIKGNVATMKCMDKDDNLIQKQYEAEEEKTKNATSLTTLIQALEHMVLKSYITICIDNKYVYGALHNNWPATWMKNEWKTAKNQPVANKEKWIYLSELLSKYEFELKVDSK